MVRDATRRLKGKAPALGLTSSNTGDCQCGSPRSMFSKANTFLVSRKVFGDCISNAPVPQRRLQGDRCGELSGPVPPRAR
jgi:hypothetical protein